MDEVKPTTEFDYDTLAGIAQDVLEEHMNLGTSGRYIADCGVSPSDLSEIIAARVFPPGEARR